jgi:hypothetical protein
MIQVQRGDVGDPWKESRQEHGDNYIIRAS